MFGLFAKTEPDSDEVSERGNGDRERWDDSDDDGESGNEQEPDSEATYSDSIIEGEHQSKRPKYQKR